jgi:lysozyme family protein
VVKIPAEYRTEIVSELVRDAQKKIIKIPATYQKVSKREKISDGRVEWRQILCETNTTPGVISRLQAALKKAGHNPGRMDGVLGIETMSAVKSYQRAKGLPSGQLTIKTLKSLGVQL